MARFTRGLGQGLSSVLLLRLLFGYLDPGSGSLIIQVLLAIILGAAAAFGMWRDRILSMLGVKKNRPDEEIEEQHSQDTDK